MLEADTCRRLCHLCFINPALIEYYFGMKTTNRKELKL